VTRDENLSSTANAVMIAGIYIGGPEPGDYGFICDSGLVKIKFRAVLATGAAGIGWGRGGDGRCRLDQGRPMSRRIQPPSPTSGSSARGCRPDECIADAGDAAHPQSVVVGVRLRVH
jgi:hypothetical protein